MDTQVDSSVVQDSRSASERLNQECFCITLDREARASETMPTNACMFFYVCKGCGIRLKPREGDCCVFCSYGDVHCPPIQEVRTKGEKSGCCK